ncbi:unnamed protein product [Rotaria sp. Silwood2]|nr:unnamed protein product [Rotaria sp. Silwood2]CAF4397283.1 unnamed protein product [Rotaria sp. Silwood2]
MKSTKSTMCSQDTNVKIKDNVNNEHDRVDKEKKDSSLSPSDFVRRPNVDRPSLSSDSNISGSVKSFASGEVLSRIYSAPVSPNSEIVKKSNIWAKENNNQAIVATLKERRFRCEEFLKKYYCFHVGSKNVQELEPMCLKRTGVS